MTDTLTPDIVETLWQAFRKSAIPPQASEVALRDMRIAFFFGVIAMEEMLHAAGQIAPAPKVFALQSLLDESLRFIHQENAHESFRAISEACKANIYRVIDAMEKSA